MMEKRLVHVISVAVVSESRSCSALLLSSVSSFFGGELGVMSDGAMVRLGELCRDLKRIKYVLDLDEKNIEAIKQLLNWVAWSVSDQEFMGKERIRIISESGEEELISGDRHFFIDSIRQESKEASRASAA